MSSPFVVIGGGIAGMAAAWRLARAGLPVTLLEAHSSLGGRLAGMRAAGAPTLFDNGPHLFLSAYARTRQLLKEMGLAGDFEFPWPGRIPCLAPDGRSGVLREWPLPAPFNFSAGLLSFPLLSWKARRRAVLAARSLMAGPIQAERSAAHWLETRSETEERVIFWDPLVRATLNAPPEAVPARDLQAVLRRGFAHGWRGGRLGYAKRPLGKIFGEGMLAALQEAGVRVRRHSFVREARVERGRIVAVRLRDGETIPCRAVVAALPPWALRDFRAGLPNSGALLSPLRLHDWRASEIVSLYLWADPRPWLEAWISLPGRSTSWVFDYVRLWGDRKAPLGVILELPELPLGQTAATRPGTIEAALADLTAAFPQLARVRWKALKLVRERRATPLRPRELWGVPLSQTTALPNLVLAGDWLDPDLPPTVEAAVRMGEEAIKITREII
jgi:glycine/D-amino acid oxidase-like deaminating enzyme